MPKRVQRRRVAGQPGMPPDAIYVGRPGKWGNPYSVSGSTTASDAVAMYADLIERTSHDPVEPKLRHDGLGVWDREIKANIRRELAGKDLACWCPLDQPCHADVLLDLANAKGVQ